MLTHSFSMSYRSAAHRDLHSFPTRRSSDLGRGRDRVADDRDQPDDAERAVVAGERGEGDVPPRRAGAERRGDRKSTRLNSSHTVISYAVFCLKKKKKSRRDGRHWHVTKHDT